MTQHHKRIIKDKYENIHNFCDQFDSRDITKNDVVLMCRLYDDMLDICGGPYNVRGGYRRALQVVAIDRVLSGWNDRWHAYYDQFQVRPKHFSTLFRRYPNIERTKQKMKHDQHNDDMY